MSTEQANDASAVANFQQSSKWVDHTIILLQISRY